MKRTNLYAIVTIICIIFIFMGMLLGYYISKYKYMRNQWLDEMTTRQELERKIDNLESRLSTAKQELSAKENMLNIYQQNLDSLKERLYAINQEDKDSAD